MITLEDFLVLSVWMIVMLVGVFIYRNSRLTGDPARKYFVPAFLLHVIGSISFGLIYALYYGYGDTFGYYNISMVLRKALLDDPSRLGTILVSFDISFYNDLAAQYGYRGWYAMMPHTVAVAKAAAFFGFLTGGMFFSTSLFFGLFSFLGSWALYRTFQRIFPALYLEFAYVILLFPSIWFWGSGLSKDSLTFGALGILIYGCYHLFFLRRSLFKNALLVIIASYILYNVKPYVLVAFLPAALSWGIINYQQRIQSPVLRKLFFPLALLLLLGGFSMINQFLSSNLEQFSLENVQGNVLDYRESLERSSNAGSQYSLWSVGGGNVQFFTMTIPAIITTFFRPFPWEVHSIFAILAGAESLWMLILFWRLIRRIGLRKMLGTLYRQPIVLFCTIFAIIFGISVGIASQNFGTMVRYRLPALPMFMAGLLIAYYSVTGKSLWYKKPKSDTVNYNKFKRSAIDGPIGKN